MLDQVIVEKLRERYIGLHPLIFHRSVESSKSLGELFDYLDGCPKTFPLAWDDREKRWNITDLLQLRKP